MKLSQHLVALSLAGTDKVYVQTTGMAQFFLELRDIMVAQRGFTHSNTEHTR